MAYADFVAAVAKDLNTTSEVLLSRPRTFMLNTNHRGKKMVNTLKELGIDLKGKNVLDIGCAYGGMTIECAKEGASAIGVDVGSKNLGYARANAIGEGDVAFHECDATSNKLLEIVGSDWADLIILNDVFEHIYDTPRLLENIVSVAKKGALLYYVVPNGKAVRFVLSEGHRKVFAVSLADPDCWHYFVPGRPRIFYRRWAYFNALFREFGMEHSADLNRYCEDPRAEIELGLARILEELDTHRFEQDEANAIAREEVEKYRIEVQTDLANMTDRHLDHKYVIDFWRGLLRIG